MVRLNRIVRTATTGLLGALALALAPTGCGGRDAARAVDGPRVVSVSKQINEFIYAIGAEDVLVARDLSSIYPPEIQALPSVGYHRALSAEGITSLRPTLFLTDGHVGPESVLDLLRKVGVPIEVMEPGGTAEGAQRLLQRLGEYFHREQAADSVLAEWRRGMQGLWEDTAQWSGTDRPRVLLIHFGQIINAYLAINRGRPGDTMLRWAGAVNAVDSVGGMTRLTPELIARAAPDVIIATNLGFDRYGSAEEFATMPGIALTPAGRSGRIYRINEQKIMYFGPRTPEAVRELTSMIHR